MRYLGQTITFLQQETTEIKNRFGGCVGDILQIQTRADLGIISPSASTQSNDENQVNEEVGKQENEKDGKKDMENLGSSEDGTEDGHSSNKNCDQDSDISFMSDTDEEIDTVVIVKKKIGSNT